MSREPSSSPRMPLLAGTKEVVAILGVSKQRAHQLTARSDFPQPVQVLAATPVWIRAPVEQYAAERRTEPGRPASMPDPSGNARGHKIEKAMRCSLCRHDWFAHDFDHPVPGGCPCRDCEGGVCLDGNRR